MALSAAIVFEIRQGGSDTNGGGFKTGASGTDWTLQDAAQYSVTNGVTNGSTTITMPDTSQASWGTDVVGNCIYVQGGTGSVAANWYEITSRTNSTTIVVDRSTGLTAGTGVTLKIGGAFATPGVLTSVSGGIGGVLVSGQKAWVKYNATAMNCSTSTAGPAGPCSLPSSINFAVEGYDATRGDRTGNRPTYRWTAAAPGSLTYLFVAAGGSRQHLANIQVDGNATNNVGGFNISTIRCSAIDCVAIGCSGTAAVGFNVQSATVQKCQTQSAVTGFSIASSTAGASIFDCDATGGTTGFSVASTGGAVVNCLARSVPTGFTSASTNAVFCQCTADSCTTKGFNDGSTSNFINCLATNCSGSGVGFSAASVTVMINCAYYNNTTNISGTPAVNFGAISLSADPYVNQAGADFRPNSTAGGGASIRAAGIGVYGQTDNVDVGAVQHGDAGPFFGYIAMP